VITTSLKDKETAVRTHKRKLKRIRAKQKWTSAYSSAL
jgi:hypothetical protein